MGQKFISCVYLDFLCPSGNRTYFTWEGEIYAIFCWDLNTVTGGGGSRWGNPLKVGEQLTCWVKFNMFNFQK